MFYRIVFEYENQPLYKFAGCVGDNMPARRCKRRYVYLVLTYVSIGFKRPTKMIERNNVYDLGDVFRMRVM